ncbi:MAG: Asp23/Gls24 family envelope stress response protein [Tetragenococcus halophilus]|uniref:Asp23/Gls24 family envelope stress response protein n=1 Tax=Tetragenococcus halophilus TaxID=51669 RepID=UPI001031D727|nr:Asp23/Gls24 family envelope stress response protein [Tetragenococcus halophilus]MDN6497725.1 Asp23/Gls24 family envelope stress response protein [Tetragenococcus koreensis]MCO8289507.1 Asp23/Gls24 family envelope stress response protein [Tetragenococcus halophilus]MCO8291133.1 Asp23/Gls24 family envelope stress response protein [Tetragenococcus halophilus]MDN6112442.1 Asp23/Gls24 family envelope stress response protein [Tetragenococcus halophilus]MDN6127949.1 Asp23/Gls24 family envelope str
MEKQENKVNINDISGELTFAEKVVKKIIGYAMDNIDGLLTINGGFFSNIAEKLVNTNDVTTGINAEVGKKQVAVDMDVVVEYDKDSRHIYDEIKRIIAKDISEMTHLEVVEVNVNVVDIKTQEQYEEESETVQDKVTSAGKTTGHYISQQTSKATQSVNESVENFEENREPRVE